MSTKKKIMTRLLRLWVTVRGRLMKWSFKTIILVFIIVGAYHSALWCKYMAKYAYHAYILDDLHNSYTDSYDLSDELCFYENGPHSYIRDKMTDEIVVRDIFWIAGSMTDDSLLCFRKDDYRGFLNRHTGKVVIPADRYKKAWLFSEGLAAVMEEDSSLIFINPSGKKTIGPRFKLTPKAKDHDFMFTEGYCAIISPNDKWGLIDHEGNWAVKPQYDDLFAINDGFWIVEKDGMKGLLDNKLRLVAEPIYQNVDLCDEGIEVLKKDFTRQLLSFDGHLIHPFTYTKVEDLNYKNGCEDEAMEDYTWEMSPYKAYYTTYEDDDQVRVGLLSPEGKPVTPPIYQEITAVNANCFRGFYEPSFGNEGLSVLFNNKGQIISPSE